MIGPVGARSNRVGSRFCSATMTAAKRRHYFRSAFSIDSSEIRISLKMHLDSVSEGTRPDVELFVQSQTRSFLFSISFIFGCVMHSSLFSISAPHSDSQSMSLSSVTAAIVWAFFSVVTCVRAFIAHVETVCAPERAYVNGRRCVENECV